MERAEAEAILDGDRETAIALLIRVGELIEAPERVGEVVEHWPRRCRTCARVFDGQELVDAAEPRRHQVAELPPIAVRVTEHRLRAVRCPACASPTRAELPCEVPRSAFGPRLQAAVVTFAVRNRVSRRDTTELARELFGVELATGSVDAIIQRPGRHSLRPTRGSSSRSKRRRSSTSTRPAGRPPAATGRSGAR